MLTGPKYLHQTAYDRPQAENLGVTSGVREYSVGSA